MNIKTSHSTAISNQYQTSLFDSGKISISPILFFGYKKDKFGNINDPKLVYIDEELVKWTLTQDMVEAGKDTISILKGATKKAVPKLKENIDEVKKISNSQTNQ